MGALHSFATVRMGVNQLIAGLMIYFLALYIGDFGYVIVTKTTYLHVRPISPVHIPILSNLPVVGPILFSQNVLVYASFAVAILLGFVLYRTTWGLKIRAVGENPEAADSAGINVNLVRHLCVILGATLAGLAGASLVLGYLGLYSTGDTLVAGMGWIAIVVVIFARWSPVQGDRRSLAVWTRILDSLDFHRLRPILKLRNGVGVLPGWRYRTSSSSSSYWSFTGEPNPHRRLPFHTSASSRRLRSEPPYRRPALRGGNLASVDALFSKARIVLSVYIAPHPYRFENMNTLKSKFMSSS